jgi:hypothetical protein
VSVSGVVNTRRAQIAEILFVVLNLFVASRKVERDLGHVVDARVTDVPYGDAGIGIAFLDLKKAFRGAQRRRGRDADVSRANLLQED